MLKSIPFANAIAIVSTIFFVVCAALTYLFPGLTGIFVESWFHNFGLSAVKPIQLSLNSFVLGLVSFSLVSWITTYIAVEIYNKLAKTK